MRAERGTGEEAGTPRNSSFTLPAAVVSSASVRASASLPHEASRSVLNHTSTRDICIYAEYVDLHNVEGTIQWWQFTVEPPKNGHIGDECFI